MTQGESYTWPHVLGHGESLRALKTQHRHAGRRAATLPTSSEFALRLRLLPHSKIRAENLQPKAFRPQALQVRNTQPVNGSGKERNRKTQRGSAASGREEGGTGTGRAGKVFRTVKPLFVQQWGTHVMHRSTPTECPTPESLHANCGLQVTRTCP